jgi:pimeloyl-ACP methyl ester carboxylesterase
VKLNDFIHPVNYRGLRGRMLDLPFQFEKLDAENLAAKSQAEKSDLKNSNDQKTGLKKSAGSKNRGQKPAEPPRQILFVYGSHSSLERIAAVCEVLSDYGRVVAPDLPGLGGMDSLYKIGRRASFDEMADYLAWFVRKNLTGQFDVVGMSMGFAIVSRMLTRHPDLTAQVGRLISYVGLADRTDFRMKPIWRHLMVAVSWLGERGWMAWLMRHTFCTRPILRLIYGHTKNQKFQGVDFDKTLDAEVKLWQINDVKTYCRTARDMFQLRARGRVALPVVHIAVRGDRYFDNALVRKHLGEIYSSVEIVEQAGLHAPSVIAGRAEAAKLLPTAVLKLLK